MLRQGETVTGKLYRYTVIQQIGEGGMSTIYLAQGSAPPGSPDAGRWVLKEMTVSYRNQDDQDNAVKLFMREAELLSQLRHKNLPRVVEQFVVGNRYYTVMEFVEGEDLGKMLLRNPRGFAETRVVGWGIEIATVLYYLHSQKPPIIFRDLKPSNIMISRGQVKLIDFGIARRFDAFKKKDTMRIGSPGYAPPEQYSGQTDRRSDIYALGVTLHQLVTGRDPSETQTPFKLPQVRSLNPAVSAGLEAIIVQATELDPQRRFKTALDMKRSLQALIGVQSQPLAARSGTMQIPSMPLPATPPPRPAPPAGAPPTLGPPAIATPTPPAGGPFARPGNPPAIHGGQAASPYAPGAPLAAPPTAAQSGSAAHPPARPPAPSAATPAAPHPSGATPSPGAPSGAAAIPSPPAPAPRPPAAMPHNTPLPARPRTSKAPFLFLLVMLAVFGYRYHEQAISWWNAARGWFGHAAPTATPTPSPAATPSPTASPEPPQTPALQAMAWLERGEVDGALNLLDDLRAQDPSSGLVLVGLNDGRALAQQHSATFPSAWIDAVYSDDAVGNDWLRGLALAQRSLNAKGGVSGRRLLVAPVPVKLASVDAEAVAKAAAARRSVAVLVDLPPQATAAVAAACGQVGIPVLSLEPAVGALYVGPSRGGLVRAMVQAVAALKARSVALVGAGWPEADLASLESDLRRQHVTVKRIASPSPTASPAATASAAPSGEPGWMSQIAAARPDLVIAPADPWALERFAAEAGAASLAVPVLCGPAGLAGGPLPAQAMSGPAESASGSPLPAETASGSPLPAEGRDGPSEGWIRRPHLRVVSPYLPPSAAGASIEAARFALEYARVFQSRGNPGIGAAQGFETLRLLAETLDAPSVSWSGSGVREALGGAPTRTGFSGIHLGGREEIQTTTWRLLGFQDGAAVVKAVLR
jgi:serine/threonine protein kinase